MPIGFAARRPRHAPDDRLPADPLRPVVVLLSILVAALASFHGDLARRIRQQEHGGARGVGAGRRAGDGLGHLVDTLRGHAGDVAADRIGFALRITFASWLAAVAVGAGLCIASRDRLGGRTLGLERAGRAAASAPCTTPAWPPSTLAPGIIGGTGLGGPRFGAGGLPAPPRWRCFHLLRHAPALRSLNALAAARAIGGGGHGAGHQRHALHRHGRGVVPRPARCASVGSLGGHGLELMVLVAVAVVLSMTLFTTALDARLRARRPGSAFALGGQRRTAARHNPLTACLPRPARRPAAAVGGRAERGARASGGARRLALLFIDLDGFKPVESGDLQPRRRRRRAAPGGRAPGARWCAGPTPWPRLGGDNSCCCSTAWPAPRSSGRRAYMNAMAVPFEGRRAGGHAVGLDRHRAAPGQVETDHLLASADAAMYATKARQRLACRDVPGRARARARRREPGAGAGPRGRRWPPAS